MRLDCAASINPARGKLLVLFSAIIFSACQDHRATPNPVLITCDIFPKPAKVGSATVSIHLDTPAAKPVAGAHVSLEISRPRPGGVPAFGKAAETKPGIYECPVGFDMAGDWTIHVRADIPNQPSIGLEQPVTVIR